MSYAIEFDESARMLRARLWGFWDPPVIAAFAQDIAAARASILQRHPDFRTLFDASAFKVQSAEVIDGFERMQLAARGMNQGRIAIVVDSALVRLQARRAVHDERIAVFHSREDALTWLDGEVVSARQVPMQSI